MVTSVKRRQQLQAYYDANRNTILAKRRHRYQKNKAVLTAKCREYYRRNRRARIHASQRYYEKNRSRCIDTKLRRSYGITLKQKSQLNKRQRGKCAICRRKTRLVLDHNHVTLHVRGLLCRPCNSYLGYIAEQLSTVTRLKTYLVKRG